LRIRLLGVCFDRGLTNAIDDELRPDGDGQETPSNGAGLPGWVE
jgi:hypothetical protein